MAERLSHHSRIYHLCISLVSSVGFIGLLPSADAQQVNLAPNSGATQQDRREAQLAALQRSATQNTDQNNTQVILQKARLDKEYKRRAAAAVKQQQAINAYEKVKKEQIDSWNGKGNQRKITGGVPSDYTASLPPLENEPRKKRGVLSGVVNAPGKALKGLSSLRPGFLGGKKKKEKMAAEPAAQFAPPESLTLGSMAPRKTDPTYEAESEAIAQPEKRGFRIPLISKLTGGKKKDANPYLADESSSESQAKLHSSDPAVADTPPEEKKGFFSRIPLVGNKNKKEDSSAYYGPGGASELEEESKSGFLSKLSLKKSEEPVYENSDIETKEKSGGTRKDIYVVNSSKAQFFPSGKSSGQADAQALGDGTIVRMTKSGDDWSSIELSSGSIGVMRNKDLRRAKSGEIPPNMFTHKPKTSYPTTAKISKTRSATGKGAAHRYREPLNVPLPDLPTSGADSTPIGNGLLPPLEGGESTIQ